MLLPWIGGKFSGKGGMVLMASADTTVVNDVFRRVDFGTVVGYSYYVSKCASLNSAPGGQSWFPAAARGAPALNAIRAEAGASSSSPCLFGAVAIDYDGNTHSNYKWVAGTASRHGTDYAWCSINSSRYIPS